jgi:hypothetical protein
MIILVFPPELMDGMGAEEAFIKPEFFSKRFLLM